MFPRIRLLALLALVLIAQTTNAADRKSRFNWDALGAEFCRLTVAGDMAGLRDMLSDQLARDIAFAANNPALPPANVLFQSYSNQVPLCVAETRSAAVVAITRGNPNGRPPTWTEYLVVAPAADGTTRVDDVLFATRRSDTLRARLKAYAPR